MFKNIVQLLGLSKSNSTPQIGTQIHQSLEEFNRPPVAEQWISPDDWLRSKITTGRK